MPIQSAETVSDNERVSNVESEKVESEKVEKVEEQLPQDDEVVHMPVVEGSF